MTTKLYTAEPSDVKEKIGALRPAICPIYLFIPFHNKNLCSIIDATITNNAHENTGKGEITMARNRRTPSAQGSGVGGQGAGISTRLDANPRPLAPDPWTAESYGRLTPREQQVLPLVAEGKSNKEIARALLISVSTAKYHVSSLLHKLGVESRVDAAVLWTRWHERK